MVSGATKPVRFASVAIAVVLGASALVWWVAWGSRPAGGLRGQPVAAVTCPVDVRPWPTASGVVEPIGGPVAEIVVCAKFALVLPVSSPDRVVLSPNSGLRYVHLLSALQRPDGTTPSGLCLAYGDLPRLVYARTSHGVWLVHIPLDSCRHYQAATLQALAEIDAQ